MSARFRPPIQPAVATAVVKLLLESTVAPRLAMQGTSMLPLLREPMVLELAPAGGRLAVGDVVVFESNGALVAHRVTSLCGGVLQTCGDARPWAPEYPPPELLVGKVKTVRAGADPGAACIDGRWFRLSGAVFAKTRAARALPYHFVAAVRRAWNALPWRRERAYAALVSAMAAAVQRRPGEVARALEAVNANALGATARRHGCAPLLLDALSELEMSGEHSQRLRRMLQASGRNAVVVALAARRSLSGVVAALSEAQVPFALLKGAARLYRDDAGALLHPSSDFDILVPAGRLDEAVEALHAKGYDERRYAALRDRYRKRHHHAAPLFPPSGNFAVELHTALAPPGWFSSALDWSALEGWMQPFQGPAGPVLCLNPLGSALHLAVHALGQHRLRDSVLLAKALASLSNEDRQRLQDIAAGEMAEPVRLGASLALGARIAGLTWAQTPAQTRYARWVSKREDVPLYFAQRSQLVEGWYSSNRRFTPLVWRLLDPRDGLGEESTARALVRIVGRVLASGCAGAYASMMRDSQ